MKIGVSTSCLYPLLTEESLREVGKSGIGNTEIFFNSMGELSRDFVKQLKAIKTEYGINVLSIHPTMSLAESFMLFSAYDRRKEEGLETFKRYGEIAAELGARYIILHGGKPNGILNDEEYFERFSEIGRAAFLGGGILLQENVAKYRAGNLDFLLKMAKYLGDEARFCLDVKQCIRGGYSPFETMAGLKASVKHIHLSDSDDSKDCKIPYDGNFPFTDFLDLADKSGFSGDCIVEVYRDSYKEYKTLFDSVKSLCAECAEHSFYT